jgi:hypothetical protein
MWDTFAAAAAQEEGEIKKKQEAEQRVSCNPSGVRCP